MAETPTRSGPSALGTAAAAIKTAGGAGTWVLVRSILVTNTGAVSANVTAGIATSATDSAGARFASAIPVAPGQVVDLVAPGYVVLYGGATPDVLYALASAATTLTMTVSQVEGP